MEGEYCCSGASSRPLMSIAFSIIIADAFRDLGPGTWDQRGHSDLFPLAIPRIGKWGSIKAWHTKNSFNGVLKIFETTSIDKSFGYKVIQLPKPKQFYIEYFFKKVVVVKAQRVEKKDYFLCSYP